MTSLLAGTRSSPRRPTGQIVRDVLARFWSVLLLVGLGLATTLINVSAEPTHFSPYDEWVYYDYVTKVPTQLFVRQGETIGEPALEAMACFGDTYGPRGEACTGPRGTYDDPAAYPQGGVTSADPYTPAYFAITWAIAQPISFITHASLLTSARAVGALWLAGGLIMLFLLCREFKLRPLIYLGLGLAYIGSTHFAYTYISSDAPSFLMGAGLAWLGVRYANTGRGRWWLVGGAVVATWFKVTNILEVGVIVVALALMALTIRHRASERNHPRPRSLLTTAVFMAIASVLAELLWLGFRAWMRVGDSPNQGVSGALTPRGIVAYTFTFIFPSDRPDALSSWPLLLLAPMSGLLLVGVTGWFLVTRGASLNRAWSVATAAAAVAFAPALAVAMQVLMGEAAPVSSRYGGALVPMFLIALGMIMRNKLGVWLLVAYGGGITVLNALGLLN